MTTTTTMNVATASDVCVCVWLFASLQVIFLLFFFSWIGTSHNKCMYMRWEQEEKGMSVPQLSVDKVRGAVSLSHLETTTK